MGLKRLTAASLRRELERQETGEALLVFLEISNPAITSPIRVVSDSKPYTWMGNEYIGFWFDATLLSDSERPPEAQLHIQNVDQTIGEAVRRARKRSRVRLDVIAASEFDESQTPRIARGLADSPAVDANPAYTAKHLYLTDVELGVMEVMGTIASWNYTQRTWGRRVLKTKFPARFI